MAVIGVVVIKISFKQIEALFKQRNEPVFLLSPEKVIFASNKEPWLFNKFPESEEHLNHEEKAKRYGKLIQQQKILPVPFKVDINNQLIQSDNKNYQLKKAQAG